jgi:uncharacterized protein (TIGR00297 family)
LIPMAAIATNLFLPKVCPALFPKERKGSGHLEVVHYPMVVLACYLGFAANMPQPGLAFAAEMPASPIPWYAWPTLAWLTLALGDPLLSLGHRFLPVLLPGPWSGLMCWHNPRKRVLPYVLALATLAPLLAALGHAVWHLPFGIALLAVALGLCAESLWFGIDDNWLMPFAVCLVGACHLAFFAEPVGVAPLAHPSAPGAPWLYALPLLFGVSAFGLRKLTLGGSVMGMLFAYVLILAHPALFGLLCGFFALGVAATRFGLQGKAAHGIAQGQNENRKVPSPTLGQRGAAEVFGAAGIAALTASLAITTRHLGGTETQALLACLLPAAAFVAKTFDTVSSEVGKARRGKTWVLPFFTLAQPGDKGGWSLAGTVAGTIGAALLATLAWLSGLASPAQASGLVGIALAANLVESLWSRFWQARHIEPGAHTNIALTLAATLMAWWIFIA